MKILVVDDEKDTQILFEQRFRKMISSGEMIFDFVYSGEEALSYLQKHNLISCPARSSNLENPEAFAIGDAKRKILFSK